MKAICPNCRKRMTFSFWRVGAMRLKCPKCHTFVFNRFRALEAILVIAEIWAFYLIVSNSLIATSLIPVALLGLIALEYAIRYVYVWVQNKHNRNKY